MSCGVVCSDSSIARASILSKTTMCKFFGKGKCTKGRSCPYAHGVDDLRHRPDLGRTKMCRRFIKYLYCNDPDCRFAHSFQELRTITHEGVAPSDSDASQNGLDIRVDVFNTDPGIVDYQLSFDPSNDSQQTSTSVGSIDGDGSDDTVALDIPWTRLASLGQRHHNYASTLSDRMASDVQRFQ
eukprot:TRINITY_DN10630_c0_g1_i2.p1 TRINITY_DN10630_c0_g1~~TRINITY_DN10630_c0_g1_i2.p1  ORF type:complete len:183 (+),score=8.63 TRINITY_DN10630_c0_g1_i2:55-603(+)